jgi:hypothetical protein
MPERTSITTDAAGRRVMAKAALNAEEAARLAREAEQLEAARHPGVVELVGVDGSGVGSMLLTAHVEGPTLAAVGPLPLEEAAGLLAALATTLADLHDLGVVHGAVAPEHVIVGAGGRPVLCGLAYGGRSGEPPRPAPAVARGFADPARANAAVLSPAFDVYAVGALARFLAPEPPAGHVLAELATAAMDADADARPSARAMAEGLQDGVPAARLPRALAAPAPARPSPPRPSPAPADPLAALRRIGAGGGRASPPRASVVVGVVAAVLVVGVAIVVTGSAAHGPAPELGGPVPAVPNLAPPHEAEPGPTTTRAGLTSSTSRSTSTTALVAAGRRDCPVVTAVLQADVDGDGCADPLRYAEGLLEAGDVRWALGQAGDQVATGDWGCQGTRTVAVFRPSTGELFRFDGWALPGVDVKATAVARVPGGLALRAADVDRDGCHEAVVERAAGTPEVIRLPRVPR